MVVLLQVCFKNALTVGTTFAAKLAGLAAEARPLAAILNPLERETLNMIDC